MNFKEKSKHLRDLHASNYAATDLELLKKLDPRNDQLPTFQHAPTRHAEYILSALLDLTSPEEIRNNRRSAVLKSEKAEQERQAREAAEKEEQERIEKETAEKIEQERLAREAAEKAESEKKAAEGKPEPVVNCFQ